MTHVHTWSVGSLLRGGTSARKATCACGMTVVLKSNGAAVSLETRHVGRPGLRFYPAGNEYVCHLLRELLKTKGVAIASPAVALVPGETATVAVVWLDNVVGHTSAGTAGAWPAWAYWFDRWVGRYDGDTPANLLLLRDGRIVPVDFEIAFLWAAGYSLIWPQVRRTVDDLSVPTLPDLTAAADDTIRAVIRSLTNDELWAVVVGSRIPEHYVPSALRVAYWSGLCLRRDLL